MNKIVIIHFSEIEEIIEKRCLLMWIAVEIYLKNGKSYFLNLLSSKNKDILLHNKNNNFLPINTIDDIKKRRK